MAQGFWSRRLSARVPATTETRSTPFSWQDYQSLFSFNGNQYYIGNGYQNAGARALMCTCGPVASAIARRVSVMGEARPTWQRFEGGKPTQTYSTRELQIMRSPWPGSTWRHLVAIADGMDVPAAGNSYWVRIGNELIRLEPDWV